MVTGFHATAQHAQWQKRRTVTKNEAFVKTGAICINTTHTRVNKYNPLVCSDITGHTAQTILFVLNRTSRFKKRFEQQISRVFKGYCYKCWSEPIQ